MLFHPKEEQVRTDRFGLFATYRLWDGLRVSSLWMQTIMNATIPGSLPWCRAKLRSFESGSAMCGKIFKHGAANKSEMIYPERRLKEQWVCTEIIIG